MICRPSAFHGQIHRNLSPWRKELPSLKVFAVMGDVTVCVSPADVGAVKTLVDSAITELGGGQTTRTEEGEEREGEAEEKASPEMEGENDGVLSHYIPLPCAVCALVLPLTPVSFQRSILLPLHKAPPLLWCMLMSGRPASPFKVN